MGGVRDELHAAGIGLLKVLVETPSFSKEEAGTAAVIEEFLMQRGIPAARLMHNVYARNKYYSAGKPVVVLNSHHDTVKPNAGYTRDPFNAAEEDGKLYGLGSNDAGGCLVGLICCFTELYNREDLPFNIILAATAEEEISGKNGVEALLKDEGFLAWAGTSGTWDDADWCAIVGEPTLFNLAIAEKGLLVADIIVKGRAGHAARDEGDNAIYKALPVLEWLKNYRFSRHSDFLGDMKMTVTGIHTANTQHNVVPESCSFMVDIRVTEKYSHEEVLEILEKNIAGEVKPRSFRLKSTLIQPGHKLVRAAMAEGRRAYGSPTCSDKALMPFPALKYGPGDSARSHMSDEYIYADEVRAGIDNYIEVLERYGHLIREENEALGKGG